MYKLIALISFCVRNFMLQNPFDNYTHCIFPADNMYTPYLAPMQPFLLNVLFAGLIHMIVFSIVGIWHDSHVKSIGSVLYLFFYILTTMLVAWLCKIGFTVGSITAVLVGWLIANFVIKVALESWIERVSWWRG